MCGGLESVNHIFSARFVWSIIKEVFSLNHFPRSLKEFSETWLQAKGPLPIRLIVFLFAGFTWAM
jgi:hypothetical protein